jgi:hypothetical protein
MKYILFNDTHVLNVVEDDTAPAGSLEDTVENRASLTGLQNFDRFFPSADTSEASAESLTKVRMLQGCVLWEDLQIVVTIFNDSLTLSQEELVQLFQISDILEKSLRAGAFPTAVYVLSQLKTALPQYESIADDFIGRINALLS